jgi:hypothetical protein
MAIKPPAFAKDAVPSKKGWHHPKTNELLKSTRHTQEQLDDFFGVKAPAAPVYVAPAPAPVIEEAEEAAPEAEDEEEES